MSFLRNLFFGTGGSWENRPWAPGARESFDTARDYYRGLLSDDSEDINAFQAPEVRRFNQETIPGLAEQFAGMGSGGLSSSGFRNAAVGAGTDLSERLAAIRAGLRQQGAQGLQSLGQQYQGQQYYQQGRPGLLDYASQIAGGFASPGLGQLGGSLGNFASNWLTSYGNQNSSRNPNQIPASVQTR